MVDRSAPGKDADAHRTIGEVAEDLHVPQHVLRFWETRFPEIRPLKRAGGRRYYRPEDIALLRAVQTLLYAEGYTIKGVQRLLGELGARHVAESLARSTLSQPPAGPAAVAAARRGCPAGPDPAALSHLTASGAAEAGPDLATDFVATLEAVLAELTECKRLISTVMSTTN